VVANLRASYTGPNYFSEAKYFAVDCREEVPFTDVAQIRSDISNHPEFANFGLDADDWDVCATWVTADRPLNFKEAIVSDVPTLVLQGEFDAITPPGIGRLTASRLRQGYYVELPQVGHKVIDQSVCGQQIAAAFFDHPESSPVLPCVLERPRRPW
jgi:pimeloyl-ACP methyl ester carboxylesterase